MLLTDRSFALSASAIKQSREQRATANENTVLILQTNRNAVTQRRDMFSPHSHTHSHTCTSMLYPCPLLTSREQ